MPLSPTRATDDARYLALKAKDARFDGHFFTGVTTTGVYCRPVCRVRTPKRENCRFFDQPAQAELAGFRPCLRCRPELAPRVTAGGLGGASPAWSMQDASRILAEQAAQRLDEPAAAHESAATLAALARRLGISERHLRRIFEQRFGVSPRQYLQTRRLLTAKQLLTDTKLSVVRVAQHSGFGSVRRLNALFATHYHLSPTDLRKTRHTPGAASFGPGIALQMAYRPPYDVTALLQFLVARALAGCEQVDPSLPRPRVATTLRFGLGDKACTGWLVAAFDSERCRVRVNVSDSLSAVLPQVLSRVRTWLDLDADPQQIHSVLQADFPEGEALRVPGALDGFALGVRAVLGQQVRVAVARALCQRLVAHFGEPLDTPIAGLDRLFPSAHTLAAVSPDELGHLGMTVQRQRALIGLAKAVCEGSLVLAPGAPIQQTLHRLQLIPGIGDWTAQYIAMRALAWPDAFPSGDVALQRALRVDQASNPRRAALEASLAWQPWRSYATVRAWAGLAANGVQR